MKMDLQWTIIACLDIRATVDGSFCSYKSLSQRTSVH